MLAFISSLILSYNCESTKEKFQLQGCCAAENSTCNKSLNDVIKDLMVSEELKACSLLSGKNLTIKYVSYNYDLLAGFENNDAVGDS